MHKAIQQFEVNIQAARQLGILYEAFSDKVTEAICLDELLRAEIVLGVSALDCYVHDLVRIGMTRAFIAASGEPKAFLNSSVSFNFVKTMLVTPSASDRLSLFDQEIRRLHGFKTFQSATNVAQALSLIGLGNLWEKAATQLGMMPSDAKTRLDVIVDRRNRIAHEGDIDPTMGIGAKYSIDLPTVRQAVGFLDSLAHAIQQVVVSEAR
jgi:hypothetical protein